MSIIKLTYILPRCWWELPESWKKRRCRTWLPWSCTGEQQRAATIGAKNWISSPQIDWYARRGTLSCFWWDADRFRFFLFFAGNQKETHSRKPIDSNEHKTIFFFFFFVRLIKMCVCVPRWELNDIEFETIKHQTKTNERIVIPWAMVIGDWQALFVQRRTLYRIPMPQFNNNKTIRKFFVSLLPSHTHTQAEAQTECVASNSTQSTKKSNCQWRTHEIQKRAVTLRFNGNVLITKINWRITK